MTSPDPDVKGILGQALVKGCLAGIGVALGFLVIGGLIYGLLSLFDISENIRLFFAVAGGPIIGTVALFIVVRVLNLRSRQFGDRDDGTA
ncbi:MAG: hypothetical protein JXJ17_10060 [Anaerolineae bacterium]|nr:hypothetical protein [Anaerolineae bacterium]